MSEDRAPRQVGDTRIALAATLTRPDGTAVDLTALTTKFCMVTNQGETKVAETENYISIIDATAGQLSYTFQDADVDTAGIFYAYFIVEDGSGNQDSFPAVTGDFEVDIQSKGR